MVHRTIFYFTKILHKSTLIYHHFLILEVLFLEKKRKLVFYGAISLDGYLARNHSLDWLMGTEGEEDTGYANFSDQ